MQNNSKTKKTNIDLSVVNKKMKFDKQKFVFKVDADYQNRINLIAKKIAHSQNKKIVFVSGPSASGKTTTSHLLKHKLKEYGIDGIVVSLDDFFSDVNLYLQTHDSVDFESPERVDVQLFKETIDKLLTDKVAYFPKFDFINHKPFDEKTKIEFKEGSVLIIEGVHCLNPVLFDDLIKKSCLKVYVCPNRNFKQNGKIVLSTNNLRLSRRMIRDSLRRGFSVEETLSMWDHINDGTYKYVKPYKKTANYIIDTTHAYEPFLYKKYLEEKLKNSTDNRAKMLLKCFEKLSVELSEEEISKRSLINEFIGKDVL